MFPGFRLTAKCSKYAEYIRVPEDWPFSKEFLILHILASITQNSLEKGMRSSTERGLALR